MCTLQNKDKTRTKQLLKNGTHFGGDWSVICWIELGKNTPKQDSFKNFLKWQLYLKSWKIPNYWVIPKISIRYPRWLPNTLNPPCLWNFKTFDKTFATNWISEIHLKSSPWQWRSYPTGLKSVADATWGLLAKVLTSKHYWLSGLKENAVCMRRVQKSV